MKQADVKRIMAAIMFRGADWEDKENQKYFKDRVNAAYAAFEPTKPKSKKRKQTSVRDEPYPSLSRGGR